MNSGVMLVKFSFTALLPRRLNGSVMTVAWETEAAKKHAAIAALTLVSLTLMTFTALKPKPREVAR